MIGKSIDQGKGAKFFYPEIHIYSSSLRREPQLSSIIYLASDVVQWQLVFFQSLNFYISIFFEELLHLLLWFYCLNQNYYYKKVFIFCVNSPHLSRLYEELFHFLYNGTKTLMFTIDMADFLMTFWWVILHYFKYDFQDVCHESCFANCIRNTTWFLG